MTKPHHSWCRRNRTDTLAWV